MPRHTEPYWRWNKKNNRWECLSPSGQMIAFARIRDYIPPGQAGRYAGRIYGEHQLAAHLDEFKDLTMQAWKERP